MGPVLLNMKAFQIYKSQITSQKSKIIFISKQFKYMKTNKILKQNVSIKFHIFNVKFTFYFELFFQRKISEYFDECFI